MIPRYVVADKDNASAPLISMGMLQPKWWLVPVASSDTQVPDGLARSIVAPAARRPRGMQTASAFTFEAT